MYLDCTKTAINSHLVQERILLDWICEHNHVYELNLDHFYDKKLAFHEVGVHDAISFWGFCSKHDNDLFKILESPNPDFSLYQNQILLSYRANANEMRKKEQLIEFFGSVFEKSFFPEPLDALHYQNEFRFGHNNHKYQHTLLEAEFNSKIQNYTFYQRTLTKLHFATSAVLTLGDQSFMELKSQFVKNPDDWTLCTLFFHIIPRRDETIFIIGHHNQYLKEVERFLTRFLSSAESDLIHNIWTLLVRGAETWCCSPSFYINNIKPREDVIVSEFQRHELIESYEPYMNIAINF
jgi:hypothetical protein